MTKSILKYIQIASKKGGKILSILLDPDKTLIEEIPLILKKLKANFILVGDSFVKINTTDIVGMYKGKLLIYLEAGRSTKCPVKPKIITSAKAAISIPLIVGGGIKTKEQLSNASINRADLVVIGTSFEKNMGILNTL